MTSCESNQLNGHQSLDDKNILISGAEYRYQQLKSKATTMAGISDNCGPNFVKPDWFDSIKYERCMRLANKYFVSLYMAHFIGLIMIIQIPSGLAPLLATGNSSTVSRLFKRYLSTLLHVKTWYESDPFVADSVAAKSLNRVRAMHKRTALLMNSKSNRETGRDKLWLNQYDFVMTQWAFIGPVILYPKECGLHPASGQDLEHLNYLWRVIGYCIGIDDQFNLCSGNLDEDRELCRLLFDRNYKPVLSLSPLPAPIGWEMGKGIASALQMINPSLHFDAVISYWYPKLQLPQRCSLNSIFSILSYLLLCFNFKIGLRFSIGHYIYSAVYRLLISFAVKRKQIRCVYLNKIYPNLKYEEKCLMNIDIEYFDFFNESMSRTE